jgi:tetratricopeptide (TPR) repeat protein
MSRSRIVCVLLALVTVLVYLPVRHYPLVNFDDDIYVTLNPTVQGGLTWAGVESAFTTLYASNWHPLTWLSLMLDCQLFGLSAGAHHLVNVAFHAANAVLLFVLLLRLMSFRHEDAQPPRDSPSSGLQTANAAATATAPQAGACWRSAFIAALFAWHPLHVESVAWVSERKDVLSTFFFMLTLLAYARYVEQSKVQSPRSKVFYGLALFLFALGLMAKPMLVTMPFVFLLLDYWPLGRVTGDRWRVARLILEKVPFFILSTASCVITYIAQQHSGSITSLQRYPLVARIPNAPVAYVKYLFDTVYPVNLAVIYPLPSNTSWIPAAGAILVLVVISWFIWRARRQCPYLVTGWFWYLGMMLPVIGLVQVGAQAMADRYTYLPLIGLFLGATSGVSDLAVRLRLKSTVLITVAILVLAGSLWGTTRQLQYWRNSETLFRHTLAATKDNPTAENNLGAALLEAGRVPEAMSHLREALRLEPDLANAHVNLGNALLQTGHPLDAISQYQEALRLRPDDAPAHDNLGFVLLQKGQIREAIEQFQEALRLSPGFAKAHNNLGNALLQTGQLPEAIEQYQNALQLEPDFAGAHYNLGFALLQTGQPQEAIEQFREVLRLSPGFARAHYNLGNALLQTDQLPEATEQYQKAVQLEPDFAGAHYNLALALTEQGKIDEAIAAYRIALKVEPQEAKVHYMLAGLFWQPGNLAEAIAEYQIALQIDPKYLLALNNFAWLLATTPDARFRNGAQAVELAERACRLTNYRLPLFVGTLAAAYAEAGRFDDAVKTADQAIALGTAAKKDALVNKNRELLKLYQAGKPYHEPTAPHL